MENPLISAQALAALLHDKPADVLVCDCRFDLVDANAGARAYGQGHITGAVHTDLDHALCSARTGKNGRHPLPTREAFVQTMARLGANSNTLIVAYDADNSTYAARLWWMMQWVGHAKVSVLDGGLQAWAAAGNALSTDKPAARQAGNLQVRPPLTKTVDYAQVLDNIDTKACVIVDARSPDRFRGENETLDPVGGHIPNARNRFFKDNLNPSNHFKPAKQLRGEFETLLAGQQAKDVINQCGSGVSACHNLLAMHIAGLDGSALYPGSWSEWCAQPGAPVARGA